MGQNLWVGEEESLKDSPGIKDRFAAIHHSIQLFHSIQIITMCNYWCSISLFLCMRLVFKVENKERIYFQLVITSCQKPPIFALKRSQHVLAIYILGFLGPDY